jgi:hypothetical protein
MNFFLIKEHDKKNSILNFKLVTYI